MTWLLDVRLAATLALLLWAAGMACAEPIAGSPDLAPFEPATATFDELMLHGSRYADTPLRAERKQAARDELMARGTNALHHLVAHAHRQNMWYYIYARKLAEALPDEEAAETLLQHVHDPTPAVRRTAVFLLGFCDTPQYAPAVRELLADEEAAGAAVRTLGKWADAAAADAIVPFLEDENERRRIQAAVALGELGNPAAAPALERALRDPVFTVRHAARDALEKLEETE